MSQKRTLNIKMHKRPRFNYTYVTRKLIYRDANLKNSFNYKFYVTQNSYSFLFVLVTRLKRQNVSVLVYMGQGLSVGSQL